MVKQWIHLTKNEQQVLNTIYLYPHTDIFKTPQILSFLLNILLKNEINSEMDIQIFTIKTSPYLTRIKSNDAMGTNNQNPLVNYSATIDNMINDKSDPFRNKLKHELIKTKNQTISAIAKHLRKSLLKDHKSCIRRYVDVIKDENSQESLICPYAYAY